MTFRPLRLSPGDDLRRTLEEIASESPGIFVVCGIGSLNQARLRMAASDIETSLEAPVEILSLTGSVTKDGAHLHMAIADSAGRVSGGHVCYGNFVRTTAELLIAELDDCEVGREFDTRTGYKELVIRRRSDRAQD
jgi:predicted DNA-binding protein with PD1-like motif